MNKTINLTILRPSGNNTALIRGIPPKKLRKPINDIVMNKFPSVEQVGFYTCNRTLKLARLEMAGGEFCGNATRSLAYLLLEGKLGNVEIKVSGTKKVLRAGIKEKGTAYSYMPLLKDISCVKELKKNLYCVKLEGITHLVTPLTGSKRDLKRRAKRLLDIYGLSSSCPAAGVMFIAEERKMKDISIEPIVWVRDVRTLFYETACASGTTAVGICKLINSQINNITLKIKQPSKEYLSITIERNGDKFTTAILSGKVELLKQERIKI